MRIGFLLGAGVSLPAGMPCTRKLTEAVLHVENYRLHSDERYYKVGLQESCDGSQDQRHLKLLLQKLECYCADYFVEQNKSRPVNYEDLFFAASQLEEHLLEEYENPAIEPFAKVLLKSLPGFHEREQLRDRATRVCNYIRDVVTLELRAEPTSLEHLTCLVEAMHDQDFEGCDIFTLNHDLLIEKILTNQGISFVDGFGNRDGDVAWWKANVLSKATRHYVLKLHGSIDWFDYPQKGLAKAFIDAGEPARDDNGKLLSLPDRPSMLLGTFNKIRGYSESPYFDLTATFRRQMAKIRCLVVSGYSFGDKGINAVLSEWIRTHCRARIMVLADEGNQCFEHARGAIRKLRNQYPNRIVAHGPYLQKWKWRDVRSHLASNPCE